MIDNLVILPIYKTEVLDRLVQMLLIEFLVVVKVVYVHFVEGKDNQLLKVFIVIVTQFPFKLVHFFSSYLDQEFVDESKF